MKIFVVIGITGEYSDRTEWLVKAFKNEKDAQDFVIKANEKSRELYTIYQDKRWDLPMGCNELDPKFSMDYTGTSYYYTEVELND